MFQTQGSKLLYMMSSPELLPFYLSSKTPEVLSTAETGCHTTDTPRTHLCSYYCAAHQENTNIDTSYKDRRVVMRRTVHLLALQLQLNTVHVAVQATFKGLMFFISEMTKQHFSAERRVQVQPEN